MSIEQPAVKARQGGKGRDIFVILVISTIAAAVLLWAIFAVFVAGNPDPNDTSVSPGEAAITGAEAEDPLDGPGVLQQDEPNPAVDEPLP